MAVAGSGGTHFPTWGRAERDRPILLRERVTYQTRELLELRAVLEPSRVSWSSQNRYQVCGRIRRASGRAAQPERTDIVRRLNHAGIPAGSSLNPRDKFLCIIE